MVIRQIGAQQGGRFVFRSLVSYVARDAGVSAIRVGGGLEEDGDRQQWIEAFEARAMSARAKRPALHVVVSASHNEAKAIGRQQLLTMLDEVAKVAKCSDNQRVAALHTDSDHYHIHCVISLVTPRLKIVDFSSNQKRILKALEVDSSRRLGDPDVARFGSSVSAKARDIETWSMLPSFTRWARAAADASDLKSVESGPEYLERWARLGVWYEPTRGRDGGVLACVHNGEVVRIKASRTGVTPNPDWGLSNSRDMLIVPSRYQADIDGIVERRIAHDPMYRLFLAERERWSASGSAHARGVREALGRDRVRREAEIIAGRRQLSGPELAAARYLYQHIAEPVLNNLIREQHATIRSELNERRPFARYGEWLRARVRIADPAALLVLQKARAGADAKYSHLLIGEELMNSAERTERDSAQQIIADFAADPAPAIEERVAADVEQAANGEVVLLTAVDLRATLVQKIEREGVAISAESLRGLEYIERDPNLVLRVLAAGNDPRSLDEARSAALGEAIARSGSPITSVSPTTVATALEALGGFSLLDGRDLAQSVRQLSPSSSLMLPDAARLNASWVGVLAENIADLKPDAQTEIQLAGGSKPLGVVPLNEEARAIVQDSLTAALAKNASWATVHETLRAQGLEYRKIAIGNANGSRIYRVGREESDASVATAGQIGFPLRGLETKLGPFVGAEQLGQNAKKRSADAALLNKPLQPELEGQPFVDAAVGAIGKPGAEAQAPVGDLSRPAVDDDRAFWSPDEDASYDRHRDPSSITWGEQLAAIESKLKSDVSAVIASVEGAERDTMVSALVLNSMRSRARVNIEEHPRAAWADELDKAPDMRYRSSGTRFTHDQLQHALGGIESVDTEDAEYGKAIFLGRSALPAFFDNGEKYQFTAMNGNTEGVKAAILIAERRWGSVEITGNGAFKKSALVAAAELGVPVSNPETQDEWNRLRAIAVSFEATNGAAHQNAAAALSNDPLRQKLLHVFGTTDSSVVTAADLNDAQQRTTAHVVVRGVFRDADNTWVVVQTGRGNLQQIEAPASLLESGAIEDASHNAWGGGVAISSGGGEKAVAVASPEIANTMQKLSMDRRATANIVVEKAREVGENRAKAVEMIQKVTMAVVGKDPIARLAFDLASERAASNKSADEKKAERYQKQRKADKKQSKDCGRDRGFSR